MKLLTLALRNVPKKMGHAAELEKSLNRFAMLWWSTSHSMLFNQKISGKPVCTT